MARILLAGDSSSTHQQLSSVLSSQGWAVKSVESREQALVAAAEEAPNLVVVHQRLHGAAELVSRFSRQSGGPGVVLVAGHDDPDLPLPGVDAVLRTPLETEELVRTVRDRLAAGRAAPPSAAVGAFASPQAGKRLTSQDIFGDLLQDIVDGELPEAGEPAAEIRTAPPAAVSAETVETVVPPPPSRAPAPQAPPAATTPAAPEPAAPRITEPSSTPASAVAEPPPAAEPVSPPTAHATAPAAELPAGDAPVPEHPALTLPERRGTAPPPLVTPRPSPANEVPPGDAEPGTGTGAPPAPTAPPATHGAKPPPATPPAVSSPTSRAALDALLAEITADGPRRAARPAPPSPAPAEDPLDRTLAGVLAESLQGAGKKAPAEAEPQAETQVDALLSRTLVGLRMSDLVGGAKRKARPPSPPPSTPPATEAAEVTAAIPAGEAPETVAPPLETPAETPTAPEGEAPEAAGSTEAEPSPPSFSATPAAAGPEEPPPLPLEALLPPALDEWPAALETESDTAPVTEDAAGEPLADLELPIEEPVLESAAGGDAEPVESFETTALDALDLDADHLLAGLTEEPPPPAFDPEALSDEYPFLDEYEAAAPEPLEETEAPEIESAGDEETGEEPDPDAVFGDYTLEERIGVGAMAEVWRARRKGVEGFEKRVALKRILPHLADNPEFVEMFIDEAKLAAQLNHNNITHIYDFGKTGDEYFIAMEYVDGRDLRTILNAGKTAHDPLPGGLALFIASRIATALDYAHRRRDLDDRELALVHRDISPQNVLINNEGEIKLCDFGIAKAVSKINTTQIGSLKGKLRYMSPEQAWGKPVDPRSDIFSLGSLLFEMLSGEPLFSGETEIAVLEAVRMCRVERRITGASGVPGPLHSVLLKALAREPDERFQTAREMQVEIDRLHHSLSGAPGQGQLARYLEDLFTGGGEEAGRKGTGIDVPETLKRKTVPIAQPAAPAPETAVGAESAVVTPEPEAEPEPPARDQRSRVRRIALLLAILVPLLFIGILILINRAQKDPVPEQPPEEPAGIEAPSAARRSPDGEPRGTAGPGLAEAAALAATLDERPGDAPPAAAEPPVPATDPGGAARTASTAETAPPAAGAPANAAGPAPAEAAEEAATRPRAAPPGATVEPAAPAPAEAAARLPPQTEEELRRVERLLAESSGETPPVGGAAAPQTEPGAAVEAAGGGAGAPPTPAAGADLVPAGAPPVAPPAAEASPRLASRPGAEPAGSAASGGGEPGPSPPSPSLEDRTAAGDAAVEEVPGAPPAPAAGDPVQAGPGVVPPRLERYAAPAYTPQARRLQVEGDVVVSVLVDESGKVLEARLTQGTTAKVGLDEAALEAARRARFQPATKDGVRVKMWYDLVSRFRL